MFTIASFIPGPSGSLPVNTAANIAASIAYVSTIITFLKCVGLLWKKRLYSKRMQIFLLGYVSAMFLLATASLFQELAYFSSVIFPSSGSAAASSSSAEYKLFDVPIALPFTIWGADMFMIWRCFMLYQGLSWHRHLSISLVLLSLAVVTICSGIISLIHPVFGRMNGIVFIIILTTVVNILLSGLITFRILHHEKVLRKLLGIRRVSPYIRVMAMCVESCSLIIFTSILFIGLYYSNVPDGFLIPLLLLPYVCVVSPTLIVYRVAKGAKLGTTLNISQIATSDIESQSQEPRSPEGPTS